MTEVNNLKEVRKIVTGVRRKISQKIIDDPDNVAAWVPGLVTMQNALQAIDAAIIDETELEKLEKRVALASTGKQRRNNVG